MKTPTMQTLGAIFTAGILLSSCVSSKKYHASQATVAKLQSDSAALAQQVSTLHNDVSSMEQKNNDLQKSVEAAGTTNAGLQKNVAYYTDYAGKQQASTTAINDELKTTLAPAGITDQDIITADGKIYVNISEKSLFKGKTAVLTAKGKEMVDNLGQFVKSHEAIDVSVADLQMATSPEVGVESTTTMDASGNATTTGNSTARTNNNVTAGNTATNNNADYSNTATVKKATRVHHAAKAKATATSGESKAVAYKAPAKHKYSAERNNRMAARAIAWKRQTIVADALLKNGIPKVKVVSQMPGGQLSSSQKGVQVVLVNDIDNFYKHMSEAPAAAQPVSKNP